MKKSSVVFWLHFLVALSSHIFAVVMPIGMLRLIISNNTLDFWVKGLFMGTAFFATMYGVNHVTNSEGFCFLTDLENLYRKGEGLNMAPKRFVPRFYAKCKEIYRWVLRKK